MKIGIVIHSHTSNTLSVGRRLAGAMLAQGDFATLEHVIAINEGPNAKEKVQLAAVPNTAACDYIILGAPHQLEQQRTGSSD